jgi:hypothetical protein
MSGTPSGNDPNSGAFYSTPLYDKVVVSQAEDNGTSTRVLTGQAAGNVYYDGTSYEMTFATISAQAFLKGVLVSPQPSFHFYSSNPDVIAIGLTSGIATRVTNNQNLTFDSDGAANLSEQAGTSNLGGSTTIRAVPLRADGSECSPEGLFYLVAQAQAFRQVGDPRYPNTPASGSLQNTPNAYSLVGNHQPAIDESN